MIRRGAWMLAAAWTLSATVAWAEPPKPADGPALAAPANSCCPASCRGSCWQKMGDWLCYHPHARCSDCDCCHNCTTHQPPLFVFFLEYNGLPCQGGVVGHNLPCNGGACHGPACHAPATCKTCGHVAQPCEVSR